MSLLLQPKFRQLNCRPQYRWQWLAQTSLSKHQLLLPLEGSPPCILSFLYLREFILKTYTPGLVLLMISSVLVEFPIPNGVFPSLPCSATLHRHSVWQRKERRGTLHCLGTTSRVASWPNTIRPLVSMSCIVNLCTYTTAETYLTGGLHTSVHTTVPPQTD